MTDTSQGDGWWQASNDKWHPPEDHPKYRPPPPGGANEDDHDTSLAVGSDAPDLVDATTSTGRLQSIGLPLGRDAHSPVVVLPRIVAKGPSQMVEVVRW
jgi:hypothetical protein